MANPSGTKPGGAGAVATGVALALCLAPAVAAIGWHRGFVTQDGPAHLYNAHILVDSFDPDSPFRPYFEVRWDPLPNWAGHLLAMGLVAALPPRAADRTLTTLTLVGFAISVGLLRRRVGVPNGPGGTSALATILALNVAWLLGFGSFLLGSCAFAATLAAWWSGRDSGWSAKRAVGLAGLIVLGYGCHLVSLGLTAVGLVVLEVATPVDGPGRRQCRRRLGRAGTTLAGLAPLVPLAAVYLRLMKRGGGIAPEWKHLESLGALRHWLTQLTWVDPISLARKDYLPLVGGLARWHLAVAPVVWLGLALGLGLAAAVRAGNGPVRDPSRRGWWALSALLIVGGVLGPDTLGATHGEYLQQRVVLLGLVALAPVVRLGGPSRLGRGAALALAGALAMQHAVVWDYAAASDRTAGVLIDAGPAVGRRQRIATRLTGIVTNFRANPLLHADCALGVGTGNIVWADYETRFYYFPVQFRPGLDRPDAKELEDIALDREPGETARAERARRWGTLLERHHRAIDVVLAWGDDPALDPLTARWYERVSDPAVRPPVRVDRRRR